MAIDDPNLASAAPRFLFREDPAGLQGPRQRLPGSPGLGSYIKLNNNCLSGRPADPHAGLHFYRGNFAYSHQFSEGGYHPVAVKLFNNINVDTYFLE